METPYLVHGQGPNSYHIGRRPDLKPELQAKRAVQDREMRQFHAYLDEAAKDTRHKYERPSFIVVTSSEAFRRGWDEIFGKTPQGTGSCKVNAH